MARPARSPLLKDKSKWDDYNPGPTFNKVLLSRKRVIAIEGAVGTAKSSMFCLYIAAHCAENPGAIWIVIRRTYRMLHDNTLKTWMEWFPDGKAGYLDGDENFHLDTMIDGKRAVGEIRFRPAERPEDVDRFMGGEYAGAVFEEVTGTYKEMGLPKDVYIGMQLRLRQSEINWACDTCRSVLSPSRYPTDPDVDRVDCPACGGVRTCHSRFHIILAFNPPPPGHWVDEEFPLPARETEDYAHFVVPPKENAKNLPAGYYTNLWKQLSMSEDWAQRYLSGERVPIGKSTCVFDRAPIHKALGDDAWVQEPLAQGVLRHDPESGRFRFHEQKDGPLRIWQFPKARHLDRYSIGSDSGEGLTTGDPSCGIVLSRVTGETVAELHGHWSPKTYGKELAHLGWWYNDAMICQEVEPSAAGRTTCDTLEAIGFCNLYQQRKESTIGDPPARRYGLPMGKFSKSRLVSTGREVISEHQLKISIRELLLELLNFVEFPDGKMGADSGQHDDRVIAWLLALEAYSREGKWAVKPDPAEAEGLLARVKSMLYGESVIGGRSWMGS